MPGHRLLLQNLHRKLPRGHQLVTPPAAHQRVSRFAVAGPAHHAGASRRPGPHTIASRFRRLHRTLSWRRQLGKPPVPHPRGTLSACVAHLGRQITPLPPAFPRPPPHTPTPAPARRTACRPRGLPTTGPSGGHGGEQMPPPPLAFTLLPHGVTGKDGNVPRQSRQITCRPCKRDPHLSPRGKM